VNREAFEDEQKRATTRAERRILGNEKGERSCCLGFMLVEHRRK
jgi:hypothetical protein